MSDTHSHSGHHHHHHHGGRTDATTQFRNNMLSRRKRRQIIARCLWLAGLSVALVLSMCVVYAYIIDR